MKQVYLKPRLEAVRVCSTCLLAESNIPINRNLTTEEQNNINTSHRTKGRNVWDEQW
jgi:hypothetical protein